MKIYTTEQEIVPEAAEALQQILGRLPDAQVSIIEQAPLGEGQSPDVLVRLNYKDRQDTFLVEVKRLGEPHYAHAAFRQLSKYGQADPEAIPLFSAPYISPETAKLCRRENIGYFDLSGNCEITFGDVYIHIEGKPNLFVRPRSLLSLYQPKAERILRVLLTGQIKPWRIQALAEEARVSVGQAFKVKELLLEREWLTETEHGFQLTNPAELLNDWAKNYRFDKHYAARFYSLYALPIFEEELSRVCRQLGIAYAFTSLASAARYAPHASFITASAYIIGDRTPIQEELFLDPVQTGANVILLSPYDDGVLYGAEQRQEISFVSPIQTFLDLQSAGGRAWEAANALLQKEVIPHW